LVPSITPTNIPFNQLVKPVSGALKGDFKQIARRAQLSNFSPANDLILGWRTVADPNRQK